MRIMSGTISKDTVPNRSTQETVGCTFAQVLKAKEAELQTKTNKAVSPTEAANKNKKQ